MAKTKTIIVFEIDEAEKGKPAHVLVSATREIDGQAEMPLMFSGVFPDRHQLADRAYVEVIKRKPQTPKANGTAKPKPKAAAKTTKKRQAAARAAEPDTEPGNGTAVALGLLPADKAADQIGPGSDLPVIEGDDEQLEMEMEGSDG